MSGHAKQRRGLTPSEKRNLRNGLLFISPWIIGFSLFLAYPIGMSIYFSLSDFSVLQPAQFVGLENYRTLFRDDVFLQALSNTFVYAASAIPLSIILSLTIAMLLNTGVKGMAVFRTIFFLPSMVPAVALAILWMWIFNGKYGIFNYLLQAAAGHLGFLVLCVLTILAALRSAISRDAKETALRRTSWAAAAVLGAAAAALLWQTGRTASLGGFAFEPPSWLSNTFWVKPAFVVMSLWATGNAVVIYLAGLQEVPVHLYEAADLDGATWWHKIWAVTIPMVSPVILFNGIIAIINTFNYFAIPFIVAPGGQPARSAYFLAVNLYDNAFVYLRMGYASAMAWILFVIVFTLTMLAMKLSERHVHYGGG